MTKKTILDHINNPASKAQKPKAGSAAPAAQAIDQKTRVDEKGKKLSLDKEAPEVTNTSSETTKASKGKRRFKRWQKILLGVLVVILVPVFLSATAAALAYPKLMAIKNGIAEVEANARITYDALKTQNLPLAQENLIKTRASFDEVKKNYDSLSWAKFTPVRVYYLDGEHAFNAGTAGLDAADILISTVEPYADVLGFEGQGTFLGGTAEDRIVKIIETLDKVTPALDQIAEKLEIVDTELSQIDSSRYPIEVRGREVPELINQAQTFANTASVAVTDVKPVLEVLPQVAGIDESRKYLVLFQNDAEIRPTGGFMTAYGVLRVEKGKVFQEISDDIYSLDEKFNSRLKPPAQITTYLDNVFYWYLRDMNMSPDFKVSMDTFLEHYYTIPSEPDDLDGVVAVDTQVLADLVTVLGPIDVPGFGTFTGDIDPRCDCPQVIYELEDYATRPRAYIRTDRKAFLAPMMQTLLVKAYGSPKQTWPELFNIVVNNVREKHVLFYMFNEQEQAAAEAVNIAGRIQDYDGDYFHLNDTNLGGAKSNLFITHEVEEEITLTESGADKTITITYDNPAPGSNCNLEAGQLCLNGIYRDYVRFYFPQGTELIEALGLEDGSVETFDELGKTVVAGFFKFGPQSQAKLKLNVKVPYNPGDGPYKYLIQKQPGQKTPKYTILFNEIEKEEFELKTDKEVVFGE